MSFENGQVAMFFKKVNIGDESRKLLKNFLSDEAIEFPEDSVKQHIEPLIEKHQALVIELNDDQGSFFSYQELHQLNPILGSLFGELIVQNEKKDTVVSVYDRDRLGSMTQGARYHQTREGGSIHTDNVNMPELWDYLFMSCISPALVGGENILVDGIKIHQRLLSSYPKALKVLESPFYWEMRGLSDKLYQAPIITYNAKEEPLFRHLRPYMESAHLKAGAPLNNDQLFAVDVLDALTNSTEFQTRYQMKKGDILMTKDAQVLHGRTCFSDEIEAVSLEELENGKGKTLKRTMERLWIKK
ncbi:MAG: alpha-ketoglutarate-dependent taurine dioxygenase [Bacteriovoracaceae bacterium]|jgi:alpha-ketoglutarate-dependent taurine dioxygenase